MAAKRVAKSAVNWAAFAERVHPNEREAYRAFKAHSDAFVARIYQYPENLPAIDFSHYTSRIANPALVTEFEKAYKALDIPYPKDKNKVKEVVDQQEKEAMEESKQACAGAQQQINEFKLLLTKIKELPPYDEMTPEMFEDFWPETRPNPEKPSIWPHTKSYQPENDPSTIY